MAEMNCRLAGGVDELGALDEVMLDLKLAIVGRRGKSLSSLLRTFKPWEETWGRRD
jgi:hypothetical protein